MISQQSKVGLRYSLTTRQFAEIYQTLSLFSKIWKLIMKNYYVFSFPFFLATAVIEKQTLKTGGTNNMTLTLKVEEMVMIAGIQGLSSPFFSWTLNRRPLFFR